ELAAERDCGSRDGHGMAQRTADQRVPVGKLQVAVERIGGEMAFRGQGGLRGGSARLLRRGGGDERGQKCGWEKTVTQRTLRLSVLPPPGGAAEGEAHRLSAEGTGFIACTTILTSNS